LSLFGFSLSLSLSLSRLFCEKNRICIFFFVRFLEIKMAREASTFAGIR